MLADMSSEDRDDFAVEIDAEGHSAGVELENIESSEEQILQPFDPRKIDVTTETRNLDTLIKRLEIGQIDLDPDFQRSRGIWTNRKKSLLIESLLLRIPLPTFYVAEVEDDVALGEDRWAVVDGIQRLSTLAQFVAPNVLDEAPLILNDLEYLDRENGKSFHDLSAALKLRVLESQFTLQIIRKSTPDPVKLNIFARINTGGVPLSQQELRHALTPGLARTLLKELATDRSFRDAVDDSVSPQRMADREMVLRFLAFRMQNPLTYRAQDFNEFLRDAMWEINDWSPQRVEQARREFRQVMKLCQEVFGNDAFRKRYRMSDPRRPVSKALFEAVAVAVATATTPANGGNRSASTLKRNRRVVRAAFRRLMSDSEFERSISQGTGDPVRVRERFGKLIALMEAHSS